MLIEIASDNLGEAEIESLRALPEAGFFRVDNIPFYANGIAIDDIVSAVKRNGFYYFDRLLTPSGHSTIRIVFSTVNVIQETRNNLRDIGCQSEIGDIPNLLAVDIPPEASYERLKLFLDKGEADGKWEYQEACLGFLQV